MESHEGENLFPDVHQRRSVYWNEHSPEGLGKLEIKRIIERMTEKSVLFTQRDGDKFTELSLRHTKPVKNKIEVMAFVHEYTEVVDGIFVGGAEMLYVEANVPVKKLIPFADSIDKLIGKERGVENKVKPPVFPGYDYPSPGNPDPYKAGAPSPYKKEMPYGDPFGDDYRKDYEYVVSLEFDGGQNSGPLTGTFKASEVETIIGDLKRYIPLGTKDSQGRKRKAYLVQDAKTKSVVRRIM